MTYSQEQIIQDIAGASEVVDWFGRWPSFHDAEIVSLYLNREAESILKVHCFNTSSALTKGGHYKTNQHAIVTFAVKNILAIQLADFNHQNVLSALILSKKEDGFSIELGCCYGLCGSFRAKSIRLELEPGIPQGGVYASTVAT